MKKQHFYPRLFEKFSEESSDPITDMGIGLDKSINNFIKEFDEFGEVAAGNTTRIGFIATTTELDNETKKVWCEHLLRKDEVTIDKIEIEEAEEMIQAGVKFIPNTKMLQYPFSYKKIGKDYFLFADSWDDFSLYFDYNRSKDIKFDFVNDILIGIGYAYFDSGSYELSDITDALSDEEQQTLFKYLKDKCEEHGISCIRIKDLDGMLNLLLKKDAELCSAILQTFTYIISLSQEQEAYEDLINAIEKHYEITNVENEDRLKMTISENGLNKFFYSHFDEDYKIVYFAPPYGWAGNFDFTQFFEEIKNNIITY